MKLLNVLVLGVGGNVSQGIMTALRTSQIPCRIIGACVTSESLGLYFCDAAYISPYADAPSFYPWLVDICKKEKVDIVFSGVEEVIWALAARHRDLENENILFISSSLDKLAIGNDKLKTCQWLKAHGLNYPCFAPSESRTDIDALVNAVGFPLLAKPRTGKGSSGVLILHNSQDIEKLPSDYVVQEYLGDSDNEYTVGCYVSKKEVLEDMIVCKRHLKYGTTFKAEIVQNDAIKEECRKICEAFQPVGPLNIQLRMHHGKPVCFELNVRFSGTTPLRAHWGYNDVAAMINEYLLDKETALHPVKSGLAYRYFNEAYIDVEMLRMLEEKKSISDCNKYNNVKEKC
ncbi:MAG TPA: ATP-grasp domain-containing protein [Candidatus Paraprevotella stercorigallinarum]|nr:ATP-grasp domain-containing protein [Candidatus Paraprevotella stercorigallinarum]